jgi:hypothetical protein
MYEIDCVILDLRPLCSKPSLSSSSPQPAGAPAEARAERKPVATRGAAWPKLSRCPGLHLQVLKQLAVPLLSEPLLQQA